MSPRIFLLSPATCSGARARMLLSPRAQFALAAQVQSPLGAPLGELFAFLSGLYFRGKLTYARAFAHPPRRLRVLLEQRPHRNVGLELQLGALELEARRMGARRNRPPCGEASLAAAASHGVFVITPSRGLQVPEYPVTAEVLGRFARVRIDAANDAYRGPLEASARLVAELAGARSDVILLGSIATGKYVDVLLDIFGDRLLFPADFVGRGDMSRGGLMLRCARAGQELTYAPVRGAVRHGQRPPRLEPLRRRAKSG